MNKVEWKLLKLGDICEVITGNTPKTSDVENYNSHDIPFYKPSDIAEDQVSSLSKSENFVSHFSKKSIRLLPADSILVTCIGTIGKIGLTKTVCCSNQQINALIPKNGISTKFLAYSLFNKKEALKQIANAPVVPIINKTQFSNFQVAIPLSIDYQRHIAAALDKANELITLRKKQLSELDALAESVFYDLFGDPVKNEKGWKIKKLGELGSFKNGLNYNQSDNGVSLPFLGISDFKDKKIIKELFSAINLNTTPSSEYFLKKNDFVFVRSNGSKELVGRCVLFSSELTNAVYSGFCIRFRLQSESVSPTYMIQLITNDKLKKYLFSEGRGCNISNLNQQMLSNLPILLPPPELQTRFAAIIEKIEKQKVQVRIALQESEDLFQRLMQDLFRPD